MKKGYIAIFLIIMVFVWLFLFGFIFTKFFINKANNNTKIISAIKENIVDDDKVTIMTDSERNEDETNYLIKDHNGFITIYVIDENGQENLRKKTQIVIRYLPEVDKEKLKKGILVKGREELNKILEDFE